ncbi:MAG: hypothetical protein ACI9VR_004358 [Cognaticolwellia sp.]|jgi:hypothetical protein
MANESRETRRPTRCRPGCTVAGRTTRRQSASPTTTQSCSPLLATDNLGLLTTTVFTLLARPQDHCIDVRVSDPRMEGAKAGFFLPDRPGPCHDREIEIDPRQVEVLLVELRLPVLRSLLRAEELTTDTLDQAD